MGRSSGDDFGGGFSGGGSGGFDGGGLSSGGFSGGAHRGGRSSSGDDFGGFGGMPGPGPAGPPLGGFGGFHFPGPIIINRSFNRDSGGNGGSSGGGNSGSNGNGGPGSGGSDEHRRGCLIFVILVVVLMLLIAAIPSFSSCSSSSSSSITASTETREALSSDAAQATGYYTDLDGDWIHQPSKLESGMRAFYEDTGVWPYVYILPNGQTTDVSELKSMAEDLYGQLFSDNAHFLLVFCDDGHGSYHCGYAVGSEAKTIMDDEAIQILADYLDRYYADSSLSEEEIFSKAFEDTGERIMTVTKSPIVPVAICIAVVVVVIAVVVVLKRRGERKEREQKRMQEILNTPIEKLSGRDDEAEKLAEKYEKHDDKSE